MAKVSMMQLREDPPHTARLYDGVGVDGTAFYTLVTLAPGETICTRCEGSGRDAEYDYRCCWCGGQGTITKEDEQ